MRRLRALWMRIRQMGRKQHDFDAELESHIALHTEDGIRAGLSRRGGASPGLHSSRRSGAGAPGLSREKRVAVA